MKLENLDGIFREVTRVLQQLSRHGFTQEVAAFFDSFDLRRFLTSFDLRRVADWGSLRFNHWSYKSEQVNAFAGKSVGISVNI
jgi:hypothetical protein